MHIRIKTESKEIDLIADEVAKTKAIEGLSLDQWTIVLEICAYLGIPCERIQEEINEKVTKITPAYRGLKLLNYHDRRLLLEKLDRHLGSSHLLNFDNLLRRIGKRFNQEAKEVLGISDK